MAKIIGNTTTTPIDISNKVDKIEGKGLSSNDFTDDLKEKLETGVIEYIGEITDENEELKAYTEPGVYAYTLYEEYDREGASGINKFPRLLFVEYKYNPGSSTWMEMESTTIYQYIIKPEAYSCNIIKFRSIIIDYRGYISVGSFENGKGLSSNDFTDDEKVKLESLPNSTELNNRMNLKADKEAMENLLAGKVDKMVGKDLSSNDFTDYEKNKLAYLENYDDSAIYDELTEINKELENIDFKLSEKQNIINSIVDYTQDSFVDIQIDGKTMYYSVEFGNDYGMDATLCISDHTSLSGEYEYTFYVYVKIGEVNNDYIMPLSIYGITGEIKWLEEPTIEYPCTETLFAFQTTDGGRSWIANQCYSLEVTE